MIRSGNSYDSRTQPEMSAHKDEATGEVETGIIEGSEENSMNFSPESVDEGIKASLEPLHAQITALTQIMDRLILSNSATEATTASSRGTRHQYESPYSEVPGSSRFPTVAPLTTAGYSPDSRVFEQIAINFSNFRSLFFWDKLTYNLAKNFTYFILCFSFPSAIMSPSPNLKIFFLETNVFQKLSFVSEKSFYFIRISRQLWHNSAIKFFKFTNVWTFDGFKRFQLASQRNKGRFKYKYERKLKT